MSILKEIKSQSWQGLNPRPPGLIHDELDHRASAPCIRPWLFTVQLLMGSLTLHGTLGYSEIVVSVVQIQILKVFIQQD